MRNMADIRRLNLKKENSQNSVLKTGLSMQSLVSKLTDEVERKRRELNELNAEIERRRQVLQELESFPRNQ